MPAKENIPTKLSPKPHLRLLYKFHDGQTIEATPQNFLALNTSQLLWSIQNPSSSLDMEFDGADVLINGSEYSDNGRITAKIDFQHSPKPYALIKGGWLPMPFVTPQRFLVDRNVISVLQKIRERGENLNDKAFAWWNRLIKSEDAIFNPLLCAYEGGKRRTPTYTEFVESYTEGGRELKEAFPKASIIEFDEPCFLSAYQQLEALGARGDRDAEFLRRSVPLILNRVSRSRETKIRDQIIKNALDNGVMVGAPVLLAILSILFEDLHGQIKSIGRLLIKPKASFSIEDAYNAVNDLRHIELAALNQGLFGNDAFALCTNDRAIALFWCALSVQGASTQEAPMTMTYSIKNELMPRLSLNEIEDLAALLRN